MPFEEKKMLNDDKQLKNEEVQKLVKQNLDKGGERRHKKPRDKINSIWSALVVVVLQSQIVK
jgi:hypothetical protein